jgi:inorganic pyrophosphatase
MVQSRTYADIVRLDQLDDGFVDNLKRFFETHNQLKGKAFKVEAVGDPDRACALIVKAAGQLEGAA